MERTDNVNEDSVDSNPGPRFECNLSDEVDKGKYIGKSAPLPLEDRLRNIQNRLKTGHLVVHSHFYCLAVINREK